VILDTIGKFVKRPEVPLGRVVIGVVEGDTHAIGKDIVAAMLSYSGFEVHNLGDKVSPSVFVEKVKEVNTGIVALSTCMDATMPKMKETIDALAEAGIRDKVKIVVGGRPVTPEFTKGIGADAYGKDPLEAVEVGKRMIEELRRAKV
jgi:methylmalonyl-CoA mutase cobalamin-binding domain/chain